MHQHKGPTDQEPLPSQPYEHSEVEQTANPLPRVDRDALHSSDQQPVQTGPLHHTLIPSPAAKATQEHANPGGMPQEHRLLTKAQVAEYFCKDERTIENWMATGQLSYRKIGRTIRFKISDLLEDLDRFKVRQGR